MTAPISDADRDLAAGYALGALTPEETRHVEALLHRSPELAREVAEYREVQAMLALGAGPGGDPGLKERLLERVRASQARPRPRRRPVGLVVALAASVLLAAGLAVQVRRVTSELGERESTLAATRARLAERERTLNTLLEAERDLAVAHLAATGPDAPGIQLFWNRKANTAVLHAFRLQPAPAGRVYQLWLMEDGVVVPSRTFNSDPDGHALVQAFPVPAGARFTAAAVTVEPEGGSPAPTTTVLLYGPIRLGE